MRMRNGRKVVLVLLEVEVDRHVGTTEVRDFIAKEAQAARGQWTGYPGGIWKDNYKVKLCNLPQHIVEVLNSNRG